MLLLCPAVEQRLGSREIWLRKQDWGSRSGLGVQGSGPSVGNGCPVPATLCVWCSSSLSCETKAVAAAQGGNPQHSRSLNLQQAGVEKSICTAYQGPSHRWGWKALKCPFKYLSEQAAAICCSSGSLCTLPPAKLLLAAGKVGLWQSCTNGSPLFMAFPHPGLPSIEKELS